MMSPEEAEWAVRYFRFALAGLRGMDGIGIDSYCGPPAPKQRLSGV